MLNFIDNNYDSVFMSKFWSSWYYFLSIKRRLSTAFQPQTNSQTEWQNSIMEVYLRVFVNCKKNNMARLLPMAEFAYNNAKHASMGYTFFALNCGYYLCVSYKEAIDFYSRSKAADKLTKKLRNLIAVYRENVRHT